MMTALARKRLAVADAPADEERSSFEADVLAGLSATRKRVHPKYFYDSEGSRLFEEITRLAEYYPTRSELEILRSHAGDLSALIPECAALIEFGSGSCTKVRILLGAAPQMAAYVPVDISAEYLASEAEALRRDHPAPAGRPVAADFTEHFELPRELQALPRVGFFPGSTIGNFEPQDARAFLKNAHEILGRGAVFIVGVDLDKDPDILHAAYNDARGITAAFNLNLLHRINRELGADFDIAAFEHRAFYDREHHRIEMHLASIRRQEVRIGGKIIKFHPDETIHTENSYKYRPEAFAALARSSGFTPLSMWTDRRGFFSVHALRAN